MRFEDRYELQVPLGETERGSVWSAKDKDQKRRVAIAMLSSEASEAAREHFQQIHLAARISRSAVLVRVHETGETADGSLFAAMELLERDSLRARLQNGPALGLVPTVRALCEVLEGLQKLHDQELAHGDVCPSNILVREDTDRVAPRLIGLGMGREHMRAGKVPLDDDEQLLSLAFMSPAQARGEVVRDPASDVFSMAGVLYTVLTGHPPHHGTTEDALRADIANSPVWAPQRARTEVAGPLADVATKALGPNGYETASKLRKAILEALEKATALAPLKTRVGPLSLEPGFPPEATTAKPKMVPKPGAPVAPRRAVDKKKPAFPRPKKPIPKPKSAVSRTKAAAAPQPVGKSPKPKNEPSVTEVETKKMPALEPSSAPVQTSSSKETAAAESVRPAAPPPWEVSPATSEATPKKATPKKATPKKATPKKATPKKATPKKATPDKAAPKRAIAKEAAPKTAPPKNEPGSKQAAPKDEPPTEEVATARPSIPEIAAIAEPVAWDQAVGRGATEGEVDAPVAAAAPEGSAGPEVELAGPPSLPAGAFVQPETPKVLPIPDPLAGELTGVPAPDAFSASPTPTGLEPEIPSTPFPKWALAIPVLLLLLIGIFIIFSWGRRGRPRGRAGRNVARVARPDRRSRRTGRAAEWRRDGSSPHRRAGRRANSPHTPQRRGA